jgi:hypothetical protein
MLVPAITIDELCELNGIEKIDLLKLDIEGAEAQVLENGTFLARTKHIIVELHGDYGLECFRRDIAPYGLLAQEERRHIYGDSVPATITSASEIMKPSRDKTDLICTSQTAGGRCPEATRPQQVLLARALLVYVVGLLTIFSSIFHPLFLGPKR